MIYEVLFTKTALDQLKKLDRKTQGRIISSIERIRYSPERYLKKLRGRPEYRLRVGDYRVLMIVQNQKLIILVMEIGHRRNIYK